MYGDACSADRQALVGSGRQLAGSCLIELSRLHLETWAPVENKLATHQEATSSSNLYIRGSAKSCDSVFVVVTVIYLYVVFYSAFGRRADSQSSLMNKEKKRSDGPVSFSMPQQI